MIFSFLKKVLAKRERMKKDGVYFDVQTVFNGQFKVTYRGISALRSPFDYVMYQMIVSELKPDLIIEIGTHNGGGALYLADLLNNIGHGEIHTINIEKEHPGVVSSHPRIHCFVEGWENYDLALVKPFSKVLVIDDGSHTYESALGSLKKFAPVVTPGSYFIMEDGIIRELGQAAQFNGGPLRATEEFLKTSKDFSIDRSWCDMFGKNATFNVNGYLKRHE